MSHVYTQVLFFPLAHTQAPLNGKCNDQHWYARSKIECEQKEKHSQCPAGGPVYFLHTTTGRANFCCKERKERKGKCKHEDTIQLHAGRFADSSFHWSGCLWLNLSLFLLQLFTRSSQLRTYFVAHVSLPRSLLQLHWLIFQLYLPLSGTSYSVVTSYCSLVKRPKESNETVASALHLQQFNSKVK